jgi:hypothetical protein
MKTIFTLLFVVAAFVSVNAQSSREEARRVVLGGGQSAETKRDNPRDVVSGRNGETSNEAGRQAEIDRINRDYDARIIAIRNNPNMTQAEKERAIEQLERERSRKIREINGRSGDDRYKGDKKNKDKKNKDKKVKSNNGKRLGWEKGVGNPHRNGGQPKGKEKRN